jgi:hypothetical protein
VATAPADAQELIQTAVREAGLDDFGGDSFREGLAQLTSSLQEEARLNEAG